jgi:hypothetical protein
MARGMLERHYGVGSGLGHFARARLLVMLLVLKLGNDWLAAAMSYAAGMANGWVWGIGPWGT